jgi:peptidoglycan/xylan/chitin deacetylase (PgdA/CDA1 family)
MADMSRKVPPPLALVYHAVGEVSPHRDPHGLFVRPVDLERQIERLLSWDYELVNFGRLAREAQNGRAEGYAALTFDDGYIDNLELLLPILNRYGISATVFVVSGWLGQDHPVTPWARILTDTEVKELHRGGVEIGSHTRSHPDLRELSYEEALAEFVASKSDLEEIIGAGVEVAAYPYGLVSQEAIGACRDAGYRAAGRTSGEGSWSNLLEIPRQDMDSWSTSVGLWLKKHDRYEKLMNYRAGRAFRRLSRAARDAVR